jgi:hypothetical protein
VKVASFSAATATPLQGHPKKFGIAHSAPEPRGHERHAVGKALLTSQNTVGKRGKRFLEHWVEGLPDKPRSGKPRIYDCGKVELDILNTRGRKPPDGTS